MTEPTFSDIPMDFSIHPIKGDLIRITDEAAIASQIKNLIFLCPYEIPWNVDTGVGVQLTLFDLNDINFTQRLENKIRETIDQNVSRAKLLEVIVVEGGSNEYRASIKFRPLNSLEPVTINTILKRVR